jgi:hypothetical protein
MYSTCQMCLYTSPYSDRLTGLEDLDCHKCYIHKPTLVYGNSSMEQHQYPALSTASEYQYWGYSMMAHQMIA